MTCDLCDKEDTCLYDIKGMESRISALEAENAELKKRMTHCDNCGGSYFDDGFGTPCPCRLREVNAKFKDENARLREAVRWAVSHGCNYVRTAYLPEGNRSWFESSSFGKEILRRAGMEEGR